MCLAAARGIDRVGGLGEDRLFGLFRCSIRGSFHRSRFSGQARGPSRISRRTIRTLGLGDIFTERPRDKDSRKEPEWTMVSATRCKTAGDIRGNPPRDSASSFDPLRPALLLIQRVFVGCCSLIDAPSLYCRRLLSLPPLRGT